MTQFTAGQKLTAKDLNEAFDSVAGPINPSKDYQWTQTNVGKIQKAWDTFIQVQNQNPETLEIGIGYSKIGEERVVEIGGKKPAALRRVFINVGAIRSMIVANRAFSGIPNIGDVDAFPFLGIIGLEMHRQSNVYLPGDGKLHFSIWNASLCPDAGETPTIWAQNQKLWQDDVDRGMDSRNWWWTGITLERHEPTTPSPQGFDISNDLICFPFWVLHTPTDNPTSDPEISYPILCVMLAQDYYAFNSTQQFPGRAQLQQYIQQIYGLPGYNCSLAPSNNINLKTTLGNYVVSETGSQNAYYRTNYNYIRFEGDTSPWHVGSFNPEIGQSVADVRYPQVYSIDWIDENGIQHGFKKNHIYQLSAVKMDGSPVPVEYPVENLALACGYNGRMTEPALSCIAFRLSDVTNSDTVNSILSGLFNEEDYGLSTDMQKRLIWIDRLDTYGVQYYDTCPDFRTGETPDSDISSSCLSSIQEKDIELEVEEGEEAQSKKLWSLWGFDDFENVKGWPEPAEISGWDLVTRHIHEVDGKNVGEIQYISLSALSGGGGAPGDADLPIAGLSSIQTRTLTGGEKVLQLYKFDDGEYLEDDIGGHLSSYDMVLRNREDNCVAYGSLSAIGGEVDLSGTDGTHKKGSAFKFQSAGDSNINVSIDNNGVITIGAYYV